MTIRFCDLDGSWANVVGESGTEQGGPGGLLAIFRGTGSTNVMAPGDIVYVKGTNVKTTRLVIIEVTAHLWSLGDEVKDNNTGSEWTGVICEIIDVNNLIVELDVGFQESDITDGNGINNTTAVDTDAIVSANDYYLRINVGGNTTTGNITIQGMNSDYSTVEMVTFDCEDTGGINVLYGLFLGSSADYLKLSYLGFTNAVNDGIYANTANADYAIIDHCKSFLNNRDGINAASLRYATIAYTIIENNGRYGVFGGQNLYMLFSRITDNTSIGWVSVTNYCTFYGCLVEGNTGDNMYVQDSWQSFFNCVFDGSGVGSGIRIHNNGTYHIVMIGNRLTNNNQYGIEMIDSVSDSNYENYNVIYGSGVSPRLNILPGANSIDDSITDGYDGATFNVADGADLDSTEINLFWDA